MKENVAIKIIEAERDNSADILAALPSSAQKRSSLKDKIEAQRMAIEALKKQIPKKPVIYSDTNRADCPICNNTVRGIDKPFGDYCSRCGQKLDWSV